MKKRKIKTELVPFFEKAMEKQHIFSHIYFIDVGDETHCISNLSSRQYHSVIMESRCLKQQRNKKTPVISYDALLHQIPKQPRKNCISLFADAEKILNLK